MYNISKVKKRSFSAVRFYYYLLCSLPFFISFSFISYHWNSFIFHWPQFGLFVCLYFSLFILLENFPTFDMYYNILCQHLSFLFFFTFLFCVFDFDFFSVHRFFQSFHDLYDRIFLLHLLIILHYIETRNLHAHKIKRFKPLIIPSYDTK